MRYLDTSLIIAALTQEAATYRAQPVVTDTLDITQFVSEWSLTEVSSALSIKTRMNQLDRETRAATLAKFNRYVGEAFTLMPVVSSHFRKAAAFTDDYRTGLRAGDALHLAIAASLGATVWTLDQRMAEAGLMLGVPTILV